MIEQIKEKLKALAEQQEQMIANLNAICGAQQVLQELMAEAEQEEQDDRAAD